jgi:hypothetical protein
MVLGFIKRLTGKDEELVEEGSGLFNKGEYDKALVKIIFMILLVNKDNGDANRKIERIKYIKEKGKRLFNNGEYDLLKSLRLF